MVPKRDGGQRPIINLKKLNFFVQTEHFKMEGNSHAQRSPKARQLDDKSRPERCLLHDTSSNKNHRKLLPDFIRDRVYSREKIAGLVFLLENMGFIINYPKSILKPSKMIEFLQETQGSGQPSSQPCQDYWANSIMSHRQFHLLLCFIATYSLAYKRPWKQGRSGLCDTGQTNTGMHRGIGLVGETVDQLE